MFLWFVTYLLLWTTQLSAQNNIARWVNYCGDGNLRTDLGEQCDDWNYINGDGCSSNCEDETRVPEIQSTPNLTTQPSGTTTYRVFMMWEEEPTYLTTTLTAREICDAWPLNGAVCEPWYGGTCVYCTETCDLATIIWSICWDGKVDLEFEQCDDGNTFDDDGCSSTCTKENKIVVQVPQQTMPANQPLRLPQPIIQEQVIEWERIPLPAPTIGVEISNTVQAPAQQIIPTPQEIKQPTLTIVPVAVDSNIEIITWEETDIVEVIEVELVQQDPYIPVRILTPLTLISPSPMIVACGDWVLQMWEQCDDGNTNNNDWCSMTCNVEKMVSLSTNKVPTRIEVRDQTALRTTPSGEGIGYTQPYPVTWLSETWSYLPFIHLQTIYLFLSIMIWGVWALLFRKN